MIITRTPFRVSFFGGGTDYPAHYREHGGAVLSTTINKYGYISVRFMPPIWDYRYRIRYTEREEVKSIPEINHPSVRECLAHLGFHNSRLEIQHNSDLPALVGLGASSSFTVGLLNALYGLRGQSMGKEDLARKAIFVEQELIKENVGSQDQTAAAFGGLNRIDFGGKEEISVKPLDIRLSVINELQKHCLLVYTGLARIASDVAKDQIKNTPQKGRELGLMHAMVDEGEKILRADAPSFKDFGSLLHEGWMIKKILSSKIANPAIEELYEKARHAGAYGGKLLGAGGGGFLLVFAPYDTQARIKNALKGFVTMPVEFENEGSRIVYHLPAEEYEEI